MTLISCLKTVLIQVLHYDVKQKSIELSFKE